MKKCSKCNIIKDYTEFHKYSKSKDGYRGQCKMCRNNYNNLYNKDYVKRPEVKELLKEKRQSEKYKESIRIYRQNNKDKLNKQKRNYRKNNRDKILQSKKDYYNRKKNDPLWLLTKRLRNRTTQAFRVSKWYKNTITRNILGDDYDIVYKHIENQFTEGMSWDNISEWHIDHIIPLSLAKTEEELIKLCHYTNLQPLWIKDNLSKYNKIFNK